MTVSAIAVSFLLVLQTGKGSIEGTVVSSTTNKPIAGAQVTAISIGAPIPPSTATSAGTVLSGTIGGVLRTQETGPLARPSASSDSSGRFVFQNLEPGRYIVQAGADGYARQEFGPLPEGQAGMSTSVNVVAGQATAATVLHLTPGGTISGRVTGGNGEPLVGMDITLLRQTYTTGGRRNVGQVSNGQTNDRGEYRLFWVAPGRYYVLVAASNRPIGGMPIMSAASANSKYPRTFYPGTTNLDGASEVEIPPGGELSGIDFRLTQVPAYRVRGRVIDGATGQVPRVASISIVPRDSMGLSISSTSSPYNSADGTFELRDILPGSYWIRAQLPMSAIGFPAGAGGPQRPPMALASIEVRGNDVDNVVLTILPPMSISGRIQAEGQAAPAFGNMRVSLQPAMTGILLSGPPQPAAVNPDGTFQITNVSPGEYQLAVPGFGPTPAGGGGSGIYIKSARLAGVDVLKDMLVVDGPVSGELQIVVSATAGQVDGTVIGDNQQVPSRIQIVLIPEQRDRRDLYKNGISDPSGHFTVRAVPPGSYKVFAVDQSLMTSFFDPAVLLKYESAGRSITVGENSVVSVDLKVIR